MHLIQSWCWMKISLTHKRKNKIGHNLKTKMMTVKVLQLRLWQWKKQKKPLITLNNSYILIMQECDPNADTHPKYVVPLLKIQLATDSRSKRTKRTRRLAFNFFLTSSSRMLIRCHHQILLLSIKLATLWRSSLCVMVRMLTITLGWNHAWMYCNCWHNCFVYCP